MPGALKGNETFKRVASHMSHVGLHHELRVSITSCLAALRQSAIDGGVLRKE